MPHDIYIYVDFLRVYHEYSLHRGICMQIYENLTHIQTCIYSTCTYTYVIYICVHVYNIYIYIYKLCVCGSAGWVFVAGP